MQEISERLARIETLMEVYNNLLQEHIKATRLLEKEVHDLWRWKFMVAGGLAVIAFVSPLLMRILFK